MSTNSTGPYPASTAAPRSARPSLPRHWGALSVAVQLGLVASALAGLFVIWSDQVILDVWRRLAEDPLGVPQAEAERADALGLWKLVEVVPIVLCGVLFVVWLFQAHRSDRLDPDSFERRSGWAIGAWFVPVVNFWFPYQVVSDLRRGGERRSAATRPSTLVQACWWGAFWAMNLSARGAASMFGRADETPEDRLDLYVQRLETAIAWEQVSEVLTVAAAALAVVMVRQFTTWVRGLPGPGAGAVDGVRPTLGR